MQFRSLVRATLRDQFYARHCDSFGALNAVSKLRTVGPLSRLAIGNNCAIGEATVQLHDRVTLGNCVVVSDGVELITGSHDVHSRHWPLVTGQIYIDDFAWIATGAMVLPGVTIGRGAVVAARSVVTKSVDPLAIVAGNPACCVGRRQVEEFSYEPNRLYALFNAWLGPPSESVKGHT